MKPPYAVQQIEQKVGIKGKYNRAGAVAKEFCQAEKSDKGMKKIDIKAEREIMIKTKKKGKELPWRR